MSRIRRDLGIAAINSDVTALKNKGWCIDGTTLTSKNISITASGSKQYTYTVKNDCYLVATVHVNDGGAGHLLPNTGIRLTIGGRYVARFAEADGTNDNIQFGVHVKKNTTAIVECNVEVYETGSYVGFTELKLS